MLNIIMLSTVSLIVVMHSVACAYCYVECWICVLLC
jgi:hypothetical protein